MMLAGELALAGVDVAIVERRLDQDRNQGAWSQAQRISLQPRMRMLVLGFARHGHRSRFTVSVTTYSGKPVARAVVRVTGKGLRATSARTTAAGRLTMMLKPRRKGTLVFRAAKSGYQSTYTTVRVR